MTLIDKKDRVKSSGYFSGIRTVLEMELRQRTRSRVWYILLSIWFVVIGAVTALTWTGWELVNSGFEDENTTAGPIVFEVVLAFVLLLALLVAPAFSANAVNGDRAGGTLAILQVTLLRPGQILWGKFLASWLVGITFLVVSVPFLVLGIAAAGLGLGQIVVAVLMLMVEVAVLSVGTLIGFGLGSALSYGDTQINSSHYKYESGSTFGDHVPPNQITDEDDEYACYGPLKTDKYPHTERVTWIVSMNPFVVVADSIPYRPRIKNNQFSAAFELISVGVRAAAIGPAAVVPCVDDKIMEDNDSQLVLIWPLGLGIQILSVGIVMSFARRSLRTPAGKLAQGTRVA